MDCDSFKQTDLPTNAIKIWIIDTPDSIGSYASLAFGDEVFNGIVLDADHFASNDPDYSDGKIATYLMGQYLGLKTLDNQGTCIDDGVLDTPRHHREFGGCISSSFTSTCDQKPIMSMNFMCQSSDDCRMMFTVGQVARLQFSLTTLKA